MVAVYDYNPVVDSPNVQPDLELSFVKGEIIIVYGAMVSNYNSVIFIVLGARRARVTREVQL